jgi:glutathione S-transferase
MKLYRFEYSCYARKVQMVLDLLGFHYTRVDVPYGDRTELAVVTGGYIQVPVLVDAAGKVTVNSRAICSEVLQGEHEARLVPNPWQGPIWAYADWCDGGFEDVAFRLACPGIRRRMTEPVHRALFTLIKERTFGSGCVEQWEKAMGDLVTQARGLIEPTVRTLRQQPFVFGKKPTLADAALYGQLAMLDYADPALPGALGPDLRQWMGRLESAGGC